MPDDTPEKIETESAEKPAEKIGWADLMKEVTLTGLATYFMTEDSVRSYLKEKKLPKEIVGGLLDGLTKKKDDFYALFATEFGKVLSKIDLTKEASKFLEQHDVVVETKLRFTKRKTDEPENL